VNQKRIKNRIPLLLAEGSLTSKEERRKYMKRRRDLMQMPSWFTDDCATQIAKQLRRIEKQLEHNGHSR